ncbi:competence/damage-inducible protein cinA [Thermosyntropha lipolytica DSM 11003]|uniref:Putative competence-damage inducible protein n=1 Tax=Thermosyntropha lipolytica DSM 11003 TaxID=1123382 RepID=A0A1M5QFL3_9FIRM|nr:competence/damage-inducible protein A [Thermosyntropha lipolytica]SHH12539.1 competence/damage-inducible protein cinA [Thermosyntropha lipolytica DSM 11003]
MKKAYIIATGTELLTGSTLDTNSVYLAQRLDDLGIKVVGKSVVGDTRDFIKKALLTGLETADLVIATGGLGPTLDDLTKEVACEVMQVKMELIDEELERLKEFFARRNRPMPEANKKQAMFPKEAVRLRNGVGTAPGMYLKQNGKVLILLPGPPQEMTLMFEQEAVPLLVREWGLSIGKAERKRINIFGLGESQVEEKIADIIKNPRGVSIALLAKEGEVHIRLTAEGEDKEASKEIMNRMVKEIEERLGSYIYGYDDETLPLAVARLAQKRKCTMAFAESCTGGLLSKMITDLPGSSEYFWGGVVTYSNEAKQKILGVNAETLARYGAVSEETAREMLRGVLSLAGADIGAAITGIAGPGGGSETKPVGLVYIAAGSKEYNQVKKFNFTGNRIIIRTLAAKTALNLIRQELSRGDV